MSTNNTDVVNILLDDMCRELLVDIGDISDGYYTFNQLYHQRAILFATIVNLNPDIA